jgi:hypothetical protein
MERVARNWREWLGIFSVGGQGAYVLGVLENFSSAYLG